ncbi:hypothetical protein IQ244_04635 [Nostoc sp. LEGE 06077]|uniref:Asr1405/Asl0597 family protein n=1 Tax=Nostoc sp. LEGE 06077 TaxID=915325 RepID=UPI00187FC236|nr:Asr1405/Asl0597 family protein [Nostoc sp. LEGE 06077]MBE9205809.1 hypothetical protein [Nostoc sp. LEGE 06077]
MANNTLGEQVLQIPLSDRWRIYHRLQELTIPCACHPDGSLRVQVNSLLAAILVRSTVMQCLAPRQELLNWLEHCWYL